jgi:hypothetical protein
LKLGDLNRKLNAAAKKPAEDDKKKKEQIKENQKVDAAITIGSLDYALGQKKDPSNSPLDRYDKASELSLKVGKKNVPPTPSMKEVNKCISEGKLLADDKHK